MPWRGKGGRALLEASGLTESSGDLAAVSDLTFDVHEGEILGIIGPNGAGTSTVFNMICGSLKPTGGSLSFQGEKTTGLPPHKIARMGIARVFQENVLFPNSTVLENVLMGMHLHTELGLFGFLVGGPGARRRDKALNIKAMEILELLGLADQASQ